MPWSINLFLESSTDKEKHLQISTILLKKMAKIVGVSDNVKSSPQDIIQYRSQEWEKSIIKIKRPHANVEENFCKND